MYEDCWCICMLDFITVTARVNLSRVSEEKLSKLSLSVVDQLAVMLDIQPSLISVAFFDSSYQARVALSSSELTRFHNTPAALVAAVFTFWHHSSSATANRPLQDIADEAAWLLRTRTNSLHRAGMLGTFVVVTEVAESAVHHLPEPEPEPGSFLAQNSPVLVVLGLMVLVLAYVLVSRWVLSHYARRRSVRKYLLKPVEWSAMSRLMFAVFDMGTDVSFMIVLLLSPAALAIKCAVASAASLVCASVANLVCVARLHSVFDLAQIRGSAVGVFASVLALTNITVMHVFDSNLLPLAAFNLPLSQAFHDRVWRYSWVGLLLEDVAQLSVQLTWLLCSQRDAAQYTLPQFTVWLSLCSSSIAILMGLMRVVLSLKCCAKP